MLINHLARRCVRAAMLLLAVSMVSFCLFEVAPGDYFSEAQLNPAISADTVAALRKHHGMDESAFTRYIRWLTSVARGEWGFSLAYNSPIGPLLFTRARNTLVLTASAALCAWAIAFPFALWTALGGRQRDLVANLLVAVLLSLPQILVLLLFMALAGHWRMLPAGGMSSPEFTSLTLLQKGGDIVMHLLLPLTALVLSALPTLILHTRAALVDALNSPFVRFAMANGVPRRRLVFRHAMPAAANPIITLLGLSAGTLLSSSLLVEAIVGWPGLGQLLLQALLQRDLLVVAGAVLLSSILLIAGNLLADLLMYAVDPIIREGI